MRLAARRAKRIAGAVRGPSDKSLTHRAYMLGAIAGGPSTVSMPLRGEDCESTLACLYQMGLQFEEVGRSEIVLLPATDWTQPASALECGNSGTTMRLLSGLIASRPIEATLIGDSSLSCRPMSRIAAPLRLMGADVEGATPPLTIRGGDLQGIRYETPVASAQIKSCLLFAGLRAHGETTVVEPSLSRDHTERMLKALGVPVIRFGSNEPDALRFPPATASMSRHEVTVSRTEHLHPFEFRVPADISSAAFLMVAAAILPDSELLLEELSVNPTRTGILDVLEECGVTVSLESIREELGEPVADVTIKPGGQLMPFQIAGALVPRLIDEIPVLAVLATQCSGVSHIRDAAELKVKESDRIELVAAGLRAMGAKLETTADGFIIEGPTPLHGAFIDAAHDHRIAMAFTIAGLIADGETVIEGAEAIATSFPTFEAELERLVVR